MGIPILNTNWYKDSTWTNTISPNLASATTAYNDALYNLNSKRNTLDGLLNEMIAFQGSVLYSTKRAAAVTAYNDYLAALNQFNAAQSALLAIKQSAQEYINTSGSANLSTITTTLAAELNEQLRLNGNIPSSLGNELTNLLALYQQANTNFTSIANDLRLAQNEYTRQQSITEHREYELTLAKSAWEDNGTSGNFAAYQAANDAYQNQLQVLADSKAIRKSKLTLLEPALTNLKAVLNLFLAKLQDAKDAGLTSIVKLIQDLTSAHQFAETTVQQLLQTQANDDLLARQTHLEENPTEMPDQGAQAKVEGLLTGGVQGSHASARDRFLLSPDTTLPALPTHGQTLSISDMMRAISYVQLLINQLMRELKLADNQIDQFRNRVTNLQITAFALKAIEKQNYANKILKADREYNYEAYLENKKNIEEYQKVIQFLKDNKDLLNQAIDDLNNDIDEQNKRNKDAVDSINSTTKIITDTVNGSNAIPVDTVNIGDVDNYDDPVYPGTQLQDPPNIGYLPQIPHFSRFEDSDFIIPPSLTVSPAGQGARDPNNPNARGSDVSLIEFTKYPSLTDLQDFNQNIDELSKKIYAIYSRGQTFTLPENSPLKDSRKDLGDLLKSPIFENGVLKPIVLREFIDPRDNVLAAGVSEIVNSMSLLFQFVGQSSVDRFYQEDDSDTMAVFSRRTRSNNQQTKTSEVLSSNAPGGIGFTNTNVDSNTTKIAQMLLSITSTQQFRDTIQTIIEQSSILAGVQSSNTTPSSNKTAALGLLDDDVSTHSNTGTGQPDPELRARVAEGLIQNSQNLALLEQVALSSLLNTPEIQELDEKELQALIANLVLLLQVLLSVLAAVVTAGSPEGLVALANALYPNNQAEVLSNLQKLGFDVDTTSTGSALLVKIEQQFSVEQKEQYVQAFQDAIKSRGIQLSTSVLDLKPGETLSEYSARISSSVDQEKAAIIQEEIEKVALLAAINITKTVDAQLTLAGISLDSIPSDLRKQIEDKLNLEAPTLSGISNKDRNDLAIALAFGLITAHDAQTILQNLLIDETAELARHIAETFSEQIKDIRAQQNEDLKRRITSPATRIPNNQENLRAVLNALGEELDDKQFGEKVLNLFRDANRTQTDFFKVVLDLVLDPAQRFVKNFSIQTADTTNGPNPLSIPISG